MSENWTSSEQVLQSPGSSAKLSWRELQSAVKQTKSVQQGLANRVPHSFTFCDNKLYFLAVPKGNRENTIHYVDLPEEAPQASPPLESFDWMPVVDVSLKFSSFAGFSREEQLLRERKRLGSLGITSYDFDDTQRKFLFSASNGLYTFTDWREDDQDGRQTRIPEEIKSQAMESKMDAKLCPSNSNLVAFIHRNDVWVSNMATGESRRLTYTNNGSSNIIDESLSAGVASFIVQEEFDRYTGYWWQSQHETYDNLTRTYKILYEEVDESCVEVLHIVSGPDNLRRGSSVDSYRYPRAGSTNSKSKLKLVQFSIDASGKMCNEVIEHQMRVPLDEVFPGAEYLVRCGWLPDGDSIFVQLLDRSQQHMLMLRVPLTFFVPMTTPITQQLQNLPPAIPMVDVLAEESSEVWINVSDIVYFMKPDEARLQFIWSSEVSGFRHLYFATVCTDHPLTRTRAASIVGDSYLRYPVVTQRQLTAGDWEVDGKQIWVDENRKLIYFMATKDTPLEQHLYVVCFAEGRIFEPRRLTESGYSHIVSLNQDCTRFVSVFSSIKQTHAATVWKIIHDEVEINSVPVVTVEPITYLLKPEALSAQYQPPELFSFQSKQGHDVYGFYLKPPNMEAGVKYPCVLFVYGGPHVQLVNNSHKGWRFLRLQTIAMLGYVVVVMDCRGSAHRGLQFEGHLRGRLGQVEIEEQVEGLEYIASVTNFIDQSRLAIHGWSYGGYLSLHGLVQRPDVFKLAVAGAPVTTWEAYDTGYTERYMGTPQQNPMGYRMSSVLTHVNRFPDEENRLLLVHGLIDENVHFYHTSMLISELVKACKPYQLLIYPSERHGIRHSVASEHYETMLLSFLQKNL